MPKGIAYIVGNEAAERFSYYGMKAILVVFMTEYLRMSEADASSWYHNFGSAVYAFPLIGALVSDLVFGKYKTILSLSIVYCLGHLVLALYETQNGLLVGLSLIAIGSGGIKPCVSAHVGDQFTSVNKHLIEKVFNIFYLAINFGSFFSTLATPWLLAYYGPSVAFGIPGLLMMVATVVFWMGRKVFVHIPAKPEKIVATFSKKEGWVSLGRLAFVYLFIAFFWALFDQTGSTWVLQAKSSLMTKQINFFGWEIALSASQIQSANPVMVLILAPLFSLVVYPFLSRYMKVTSLGKIAFGLIVSGFSFLIIGYGEDMIHQGETVSFTLQIWAFIILTAAEVLVSITALEFSYTQAPNSIKSIIMSVYLLSVSLGNFVTSGVNSWIKKDIEINNISSGSVTKIEVDEMFELETGDKIDFNAPTGIKQKDLDQSQPLEGTYLVGNRTSDGYYELWDINRDIVSTEGEFEKPKELHWITTYKLRAGDYFRFFAYMIFIVGIAFTLVSRFIKTKTYIQGDEEAQAISDSLGNEA